MGTQMLSLGWWERTVPLILLHSQGNRQKQHHVCGKWSKCLELEGRKETGVCCPIDFWDLDTSTCTHHVSNCWNMLESCQFDLEPLQGSCPDRCIGLHHQEKKRSTKVSHIHDDALRSLFSQKNTNRAVFFQNSKYPWHQSPFEAFQTISRQLLKTRDAAVGFPQSDSLITTT